MSLSMTSSLLGLLQWVFPILACVWAVRTHKSRALIVLLSVGAAVVAALFMFFPLVQVATRVGDGLDSIPYVLGHLLISSAIFGAFVGVVGIVVQTLGKRRSQRA